MKNIRDSVHGDLPFSKVELELMDSLAMQRLRGIKQLGTSNLVFPGAIHTRFEHSLGTCFMAKKILQSLETQNRLDLSDSQVQSITAAALLHDITHVPFGHTLEDERRIFTRHDSDPERLERFICSGSIGKILKREKLFQSVLSMLQKGRNPDENFIFSKQIISHTICADLLDYLRRDAHHCGLNLDYDDRIFRYFQIENGRLILNLQKDGLFRHDAFSEIIHLLRIRYFLTERVYYHHAKIAAGSMLSRAVEQAVVNGFQAEQLYSLRDDALLYILETQFRSDRTISQLLAKYQTRCLYKRCYVLTDHHLSTEQRQMLADQYHLNLKGERMKVESRIARMARVPKESVIIYAPPPSMNLKEADVLVKINNQSAQPLVTWKNKEVASLQEKFGKLWKFYVFVDPGYSQRFGAVARSCEECFGMPNELPLIQQGQLSLFSFYSHAGLP